MLVDNPCELITQLFIVMKRENNLDRFLCIDSKYDEFSSILRNKDDHLQSNDSHFRFQFRRRFDAECKSTIMLYQMIELVYF
jgi:hypothetical protein